MNEYRIIYLNEKPEFWTDFYMLSELVYAGDKNYTPVKASSISREIERFSEDKKLPLLIMKQDKPFAALVALECNISGGRTGIIAYFEALNNQAAVNLLFDVTMEWFRSNNISTAIGPINGDTWHRYRFITEFNIRPIFLSEPYNPGYYPELWQKYGFSKLAGYYSKFIPDLAPVMPKMQRFYDRTIRNGFTYRQFNINDFENELRIIYKISCDAFAGNYLYQPIPEDEFLQLYDGTQSVIKPELIWFCLNKDSEPCGFAFAIPDYREALRQMKGSRSLWAKLKFLWSARKVDTINLKSIGSLSECRNNGVGPALTFKVYEASLRMGINKINMCLIHDNNVSGKLDGNHGEILRRYAIFSRETGAVR